jgi:stalled ribosome rescue protein Dom34
MSLDHAVVWIDHREAHVIQFNESASENEIIHTKSKHSHLHHKAGTLGSGHAAPDQSYLHEVTEAVASAAEILVVGPGSAKLELLRHAQKHDPLIAKKILGIETIDHPTDKQLLAYARHYFKPVDKMNGNSVIRT